MKRNIIPKCKIFGNILCFNILILFIHFSTIAQTNGYVPGEVYLKIKDNSTVSLGIATTMSTSSTTFLQSLGSSFSMQSIKRPFYNGDKITGINSVNATLAVSAQKISKILRIKLNDVTKVDAFIAQAKTYADVEYVEKVPLFKVDNVVPNDLGANTDVNGGQWNLHKINAQQAWDLTTGNANVIIAIVDDAIDITHPDLANKIVSGYDVADGDNNPNPPNVQMFHGTHVAGIAGAQTNNGLGISSIGYNVRIMPVKSSKDTDVNNISHGYEGITWAVQNGAKVINCSWGHTTGLPEGTNIDIAFPTFAAVFDYVYAQGCILVASAGNDNTNMVHSPAGFSKVISVASSDMDDSKSGFSNYGSWVDITAPGSIIYSTMPNNNYTYLNGTSMATPLVAGVVGLMLSANPNLTPAQCEICLKNSATNIDAINMYIGTGKLGGGRVDAYRAVLCAQNLMACNATQSLVTPIANGTQTFQANQAITSISQITGNSNVTYRAGSITLNTGFAVASGAVFKTLLEPCATPSARQGIAEEPKQAIPTLEAYPNPTTDRVTINYEVSEAEAGSEVVVFLTTDMGKTIGTLVHDEHHEAGTFSINYSTQHLPEGMYIYSISTNGRLQSKRLVVAR